MENFDPEERGFNPYKGREWAKMKEKMINEIEVLDIAHR